MTSEDSGVERTPIAVGGIGGSGTRVVAAILKELGIFIGDNLNASNDNLDFLGWRDFTLLRCARGSRPQRDRRGVALPGH